MSLKRSRFQRLAVWAACALPLAGCGPEEPALDPALDAMAKSAAPSLPALFQGRDLASWLLIADSEDAHERAMAAWAFAELGHTSTEIDEPLSRLLADSVIPVKRAALHAIDRLDRVPTAGWAALLAASSQYHFDPFAVELVRRFGPAPLEVIEAALQSGEPFPGLLARYATHADRGKRQLSIARLQALTMSADASTRHAAFSLLAEHGAEGIALLLRGLHEGPDPRRAAAASWLARAKSLDVLRKSLTHVDERVRYWAAKGIGYMGESAVSAVDDLLTLVGQDAVAPRQGAIDALVEIGTPAKPAIQKWIKSQPDDALGTRLRTIGQMILIRIGD